LKRFWARKLVRNAVLIVAAFIITYGVVLIFTNSPEAPSADAIAEQIEAELAACREWSTQEWERFSDGGNSDDPGFGEYVSQFSTVEAYVAEQCRPDHFGGWIEEPRFCYAHLWFETYREGEYCPDVDRVALLGQPEEYYEDYGETYTIDGRTYNAPRPPDMGGLVVTSSTIFVLAIVIGASFVGA